MRGRTAPSVGWWWPSSSWRWPLAAGIPVLATAGTTAVLGDGSEPVIAVAAVVFGLGPVIGCLARRLQLAVDTALATAALALSPFTLFPPALVLYAAALTFAGVHAHLGVPRAP